MPNVFISNSGLTKTLKNEDLCVRLLDGYYRPIKEGGHFEGGYFDSFGKGGLTLPNQFTEADILSCSLLSTNIKANAIVEILIEKAEQYSELLTQIDQKQRFIDIDPEIWEGNDYPGRDLYWALRGISGVGQTRATKLLARKRPDLFPIIDSRVLAATVGDQSPYWAPFSRWLKEDECYWYEKLESIRLASVAANSISTIRAFDVIAWLVGSGKESLALS